VRFGILQRYVLGEVLRAFAMATLTMTVIFVLFMVMAEAAKLGLTPHDIVRLVPLVIPSTLPYTVPVSMLFAVTVVYGRLGADNEVVAVKTAGLSAWTILWPSVLAGGALSAALLYLSSELIPRANQQAKLAIFKDFEDAFYKYLKMDRQFDNPSMPFLIKVSDVDVETRTMYKAMFLHRNKDASRRFDAVIYADVAQVRFDMAKGVAHVHMDGSEVRNISEHSNIGIFNNEDFDLDVPDKNNQGYEKRIQEWTTRELTAEQASFRKKIKRERKNQAMAAALWIASGRLNRVGWDSVQKAFIDYSFWSRRVSEFETEKQLRVAQSFGSLVFVLLGAPVGILFAKRDFLSAFISCFIPIILLYYPLMLLGVNLGKEEVIPPLYALWGGNLLLFVLSWFVLPPVIRH
jgi:lipopolysaccharide export system permease protein